MATNVGSTDSCMSFNAHVAYEAIVYVVMLLKTPPCFINTTKQFHIRKTVANKAHCVA